MAVVFKMLERASALEIWTYVTLIAIGGILYSLSGYLKSVYLSLKLPGPPALPILGNTLMVQDKNVLTTKADTAFSLYGSLIRLWVLIFPFFIVLEPEHLQIILSSKKHTDKVFFYRLMHNFLGDGLITSSGAKWSSHRKLIQPSFHLSILEKFIATFADASQALFEKLDPKEEEINIATFINNCIIDILNEAILGVPVKKKHDADMEESPFRRGKVVAQYRITHPWLLFNVIYRLTKTASEELSQKRKLNEFTRKMIERRRKSAQNGEDLGRKCLLDHMIEVHENNPDFTEDDIIDEACTFMLAGQDSVGAATAFALHALAQNPEVQQKCIEEIDNIFGDDDRAPTMNDLREMRYLEMCIKETLRLYPSVPIIARKLSEDINVGKYTLPSGCNIFIAPYITHRLPHIYPDPERFDPERFNPTNSENRHPYSYLPFSAGARKCMGDRFAILEMKTIISRLLRSYELLMVPEKKNFQLIFRITLRASGGLWIRLKQRKPLMEIQT